VDFSRSCASVAVSVSEKLEILTASLSLCGEEEIFLITKINSSDEETPF